MSCGVYNHTDSTQPFQLRRTFLLFSPCFEARHLTYDQVYSAGPHALRKRLFGASPANEL